MPRRTYTAEIYIVYLYLYDVTWDASLLNQFLPCSVGAKILPGKHSLAFILTQLGGVLISGTFVYIAVPSLTRLHIVHICHCYHAEDIPAPTSLF